MNDFFPEELNRLNFEELIARIRRQREESEKFSAEQRKLTAEALKLDAEAAKFRRDRFVAPIVAAAALGGFVAALVPSLLRAWGMQ